MLARVGGKRHLFLLFSSVPSRSVRFRSERVGKYTRFLAWQRDEKRFLVFWWRFITPHHPSGYAQREDGCATAIFVPAVRFVLLGENLCGGILCPPVPPLRNMAPARRGQMLFSTP